MDDFLLKVVSSVQFILEVLSIERSEDRSHHHRSTAKDLHSFTGWPQGILWGMTGYMLLYWVPADEYGTRCDFFDVTVDTEDTNEILCQSVSSYLSTWVACWIKKWGSRVCKPDHILLKVKFDVVYTCIEKLYKPTDCIVTMFLLLYTLPAKQIKYT
jgi:hypothetical protein